LVLGLKYCQDGGEPILERMAMNHYRAAGPTHSPSGGVADSLDEAKAAFRAAWQRPLSVERSGRDMLSLSLSRHDPLLT